MPGWWRRLRRGTQLGLLFLLCLILLSLAAAGFALWGDTQAGHAFIGRKIAATKFGNGFRVNIGHIEGSVFGAMQVKDVVLSDPSGEFAAIPQMTLAWHPARLIAGELAIGELSAESARLLRKPAFLATGNQANSSLPFDRIEIDRIAIAHLEVEPGLTGKRHRTSLAGSLVLDQSGVSAHLAMVADRGDGLAGGDKVDMTIRYGRHGSGLDLNGTVSAPVDGLLASLTGKPVPIQLTFQHGEDPQAIETVPDRLGVDKMFEAMEADWPETRP